MVGLVEQAAKVNQKAGLTVTHAVKIRKQEEKLANHVVDKKVRKEQNIHPADQRHQIVAQKVKEKYGVNENEN